MKNHTAHTNRSPLAVGTGLLALDVVVSEVKTALPRRWAGGTCGNVLIALRYLGWQAAPVARLRAGAAATRLFADLKRWGVSTDFLTLAEDGSTPVIVQRISRSPAGDPYHTFSWRCSSCGARLPGYKPVLAINAEAIVEHLGSPRVFFFDRLSRGALVLARACAERGAVVAFEPSSVGNPALFREAWEVAHVVKYSHERLQELPADVETMRGARLQIETLGRDGLRYRTRLPGCKFRKWQKLDSLPALQVRDTSGAGDWCMAGILHRLAQEGSTKLTEATDADVRDAVRYGQALAAWTCGFEGARGGMYAVEKAEFERQVLALLGASTSQQSSDVSRHVRSQEPIACLCPSCEQPTCDVSRPARLSTRAGG